MHRWQTIPPGPCCVQDSFHFYRFAQALAALFMMNNAHFMVKTVEGSEALMLLGPDWLERQKDKVRARHRAPMLTSTCPRR